jgi:hypothetical protein
MTEIELGRRTSCEQSDVAEVRRICELTRDAIQNSTVLDGLDQNKDRTLAFTGVITGLLLEAASLWVLNEALRHTEGEERVRERRTSYDPDYDFADYATDVWNDFNGH